VPAEKINKGGLLRYCITVQSGEKNHTFPADIQSRPADWDFPTAKLWETLVVDANAPIVLYDVSRDQNKLLYSQYWGGVQYAYDFVPGMSTDRLALRVEVPSFKYEPNDVSWQHPFVKEIDTRLEDMSRFNTLCLRVRAGEKATTHFGIALIEKDGTGWGTSVLLTTQWNEIRIPLSQLVLTKVAMLPRGWPALNPYWLPIPVGRGGKDDRLHMENVEDVQFSVSTRYFEKHVEGPHAIELESVTLEKLH
jgi:hypothetical protein